MDKTKLIELFADVIAYSEKNEVNYKIAITHILSFCNVINSREFNDKIEKRREVYKA